MKFKIDIAAVIGSFILIVLFFILPLIFGEKKFQLIINQQPYLSIVIAIVVGVVLLNAVAFLYSKSGRR